MNLDHLRYFVHVAQIQHIGRAAAALHVSPSAVSHSLRKLEVELGQKLFQKTGKQIFLTDFGRQFSGRAAELLNESEKLLREFRHRDLPLQGMLKLAASHTLSSTIATQAACKLRANHPGLTFEIYSLRSAEVIDQVARGQMDIGICFSPTSHPAITVQSQKSQRLAVCVRAEHPIRRLRQAAMIQELSQLPCTLPRAFTGVETCEQHPALIKLGLSAPAQFIFDSYDVACAYIKLTDAWCLMPEIVAHHHGLAALKIEGLKAEATIAVITPKGRVLAPAVAAVFGTFLMASASGSTSKYRSPRSG